MKLLRVTAKLVRLYKSGCRSAHDEEGTAICKSWLELKKENKKLSDAIDVMTRIANHGSMY